PFPPLTPYSPHFTYTALLRSFRPPAKKKAPRAHSRGLSGCVVAVRPSRGTLPPRRRPSKEAHVERDVSLHGSMSSAVRGRRQSRDRKSTRLNSSHGSISYAVF